MNVRGGGLFFYARILLDENAIAAHCALEMNLW